jgi:hypothetical protein
VEFIETLAVGVSQSQQGETSRYYCGVTCCEISAWADSHGISDSMSLSSSEHGHCLVPRGCTDYPQLFQLGRQPEKGSYFFQAGHKNIRAGLHRERFAGLNDLDFVWDPQEAIWNERVEEYVQFKVEHNHCVVPRECKLIKWVKTRERRIHFFKQDRRAGLHWNGLRNCIHFFKKERRASLRRKGL